MFSVAPPSALSQHPQRPARDQPLRQRPQLSAGSGGSHAGREQQQLQRDLCLHARPQDAHDHRQQTGRVTPLSELSFKNEYSVNIPQLGVFLHAMGLIHPTQADLMFY